MSNMVQDKNYQINMFTFSHIILEALFQTCDDPKISISYTKNSTQFNRILDKTYLYSPTKNKRNNANKDNGIYRLPSMNTNRRNNILNAEALCETITLGFPALFVAMNFNTKHRSAEGCFCVYNSFRKM